MDPMMDPSELLTTRRRWRASEELRFVQQSVGFALAFGWVWGAFMAPAVTPLLGLPREVWPVLAAAQLAVAGWLAWRYAPRCPKCHSHARPRRSLRTQGETCVCLDCGQQWEDQGWGASPTRTKVKVKLKERSG